MSGKLSCIIAAAALILMITAIIANALYIKNTTDHILTLIGQSEDLTETPLTVITEVSDFWDQSIPVLRLTLSQEDLEEISLILNETQICAENGDTEEYKRSMARLRRAIESIMKREEFSIDNIF